jgi:hypothetical protein
MHFLPLFKDLEKRTKLIIAGHSLGGALATMAFAYTMEQLQPVLEKGLVEIVYMTLGAPRVGNPAFVQLVENLMQPLEDQDLARIGRYVNRVDLVPYSASPIIFQHLGQAQLMDDEGGVHVHNMAINKLEEAFVQLFVKRESITDGATDHMTGAYRDSLFKCGASLDAAKALVNKARRDSKVALLGRKHWTELRHLIHAKAVLAHATKEKVAQTARATCDNAAEGTIAAVEKAAPVHPAEQPAEIPRAG